MGKAEFPKPYDGAITKFLENDAPDAVRKAIKDGKKSDILDKSYPHDAPMDKDEYEDTIEALQIELVKFQAWVRDSGARVAVVFEGRDAAGKGGTIKRFRENLNPRAARTVALSKPSDTERTQWYFQRYIQHLPAAGEIVFFDRSWYNRGVVEKVFGWVNDDDRARFFRQVPKFEEMLANDGINLIKIWLNVGRAEQLRRFLKRESDPLKQWKLSEIDVKGLARWDAYTTAIEETFQHTHHDSAPWHIVRSDDKKRARLAAIRTVLSQFDYAQKDKDVACTPDPKIAGGPEIMAGG